MYNKLKSNYKVQCSKKRKYFSNKLKWYQIAALEKQVQISNYTKSSNSQQETKKANKL